MGYDGGNDSAEHDEEKDEEEEQTNLREIEIARVVDGVVDEEGDDTIFHDINNPPQLLENLLQPGREPDTATLLPDPATLHEAYHMLDSWVAFFAYQRAAIMSREWQADSRLGGGYYYSEQDNYGSHGAEDSETDEVYLSRGVGWRREEVEVDLELDLDPDMDIEMAIHLRGGGASGEVVFQHVEDVSMPGVGVPGT